MDPIQEIEDLMATWCKSLTREKYREALEEMVDRAQTAIDAMDEEDAKS